MSKYVYVILINDISEHNAELLELVLPKTRIQIKSYPYSGNTVFGFHGIPEYALSDAAANFYRSLNNSRYEIKNIKVRVLKSLSYNTWEEVTEEVEHINKELDKLRKVTDKLKSWK